MEAPIDRADVTTCAVCARTATGLGVHPQMRTNRPQIHWVCDDPSCIAIAQAAIHMRQDRFTRVESLAAGDGGANGIAFLETVGKFDIATFNETEWFEFCRRIVAGYRRSLKVRIAREMGINP